MSAIPRMFMTRRRLQAAGCRLQARICKLISVPACLSVLIRKWADPIQNFSVPKACSTVQRRCFVFPGALFRRFCMASNIPSCSHRLTRRSLPVVHLHHSDVITERKVDAATTDKPTRDAREKLPQPALAHPNRQTGSVPPGER